MVFPWIGLNFMGIRLHLVFIIVNIVIIRLALISWGIRLHLVIIRVNLVVIGVDGKC